MELRDVVYLHFFGRSVCLLGTALNQNVSLPLLCAATGLRVGLSAILRYPLK
jgi:hypothetical protein